MTHFTSTCLIIINLRNVEENLRNVEENLSCNSFITLSRNYIIFAINFAC